MEENIAKINEEKIILSNLIKEWQKEKRKNDLEINQLINQQYCIDSTNEQISLINLILESKQPNDHSDDQELLNLEKEINSIKQDCVLMKEKFLEQEMAHELELIELYELEKELDNFNKRNKVDEKKSANVKTIKVNCEWKKKKSNNTDGLQVPVNRKKSIQTGNKLKKQVKPLKKHSQQPTIFNISGQASPNIIITRHRAKIQNIKNKI